MKKFPAKPKRPKFALMRYYDDVIEDVKEKFPYKDNIYRFHTLIIKKMYDKLDKKTKKKKYIIPFRKELKIWKKKLDAYNKKYKKKIIKLIGKKPKQCLNQFSMFKKIYRKKVRLENPNFNSHQILTKVSKLYKSKEKEEEVKELKKEFQKKNLIYKKKKKEYEKKLKNIIKSDSDSSSDSEDSSISINSENEFNLKKRKKSKCKYFLENSKKKKIHIINNDFPKNNKKLSQKKNLKKQKILNIEEKVKKENNLQDLMKKLVNVKINDEEFQIINKILFKEKITKNERKINKENSDDKISEKFENENLDNKNSKILESFS